MLNLVKGNKFTLVSLGNNRNRSVTLRQAWKLLSTSQSKLTESVCVCVGGESHRWGFALFLLAILFWVYLAKIHVALEITLPICMQIANCCRTPTAEIRFQSFLCCSLLLSGVLRCSFAIMNATESCIIAATVHRHTVIMWEGEKCKLWFNSIIHVWLY